MCSCEFADEPSAMSRSTRRARKPHRCCECQRTIPAGVTYEYVSGIWDGSPSSFKTCARCVILREAHSIAENEPGCTAPFGDLMETIRDCARDGGDSGNYNKAFQRARRELLAKKVA